MEVKKFLITQQFNAPLSNLIQIQYNKLIEIIFDTSPVLRTKKIIDGTGGKVNITDIIAYQIGWGSLLLTWYETGIKDQIPQMPGDGYKTWDYTGLAHHFYEKYSYDKAQKQLQKFHTMVEKIITIVENEYNNGNLDKKGVWQWCTLASGKQWPLSKWITVNTTAPYKRAFSLIKNISKK